MTYEWKSLDKTRQEIRVLDLKAGTGISPLDAHIRHVFLDGHIKPQYETISYAWGPKGLVDRILLNDKSIRIPASAASALRCMRLPNKTRTVWIDCICIDQTDDIEKAHQVSLMAEIFSSCSQTLGFLGDDDGTAEDAFNGFRMLYDALMEEDGDTVTLKNMYRRNIRELGSLCDMIHWPAIAGILSRLYFTRIWIVQEAVLGLKTTLHCGVATIDFKFVMCAMVWLNSDKGEPVRALLGSTYPQQSRPSASFINVTWRALAYRGSEESILEHALGLGESLGSTEPRDRVYGLLGLLRMSRPGHLLPLTLIPDYKKPIADVFIDATWECIKSSGGLWGIESNGYERSSDSASESMPTWVPTWYGGALGPDNYITSFPPHCNLWPIRGSEMYPVPQTNDAKILGARGIIMEPIVKHLSTMLPCEEKENKFSFLHNLQFVQATQSFLLEATAGGADESAQQRLNDILTVGHENMQFEERWNELFQKAQEGHDTTALLSRYHEAARYCKEHKLFVTQSGRLGLGPRTLEDGDVVAISKISQWPMILRREPSRGDNFYTMVGAAYVEGIKDGEAIFAAAAQEDRIGTFYLV